MYQETWGSTATAHEGGVGLGATASFVYSDVRSQIRTGDVLLFQGSGMLSRVIRWGSRSAYSHAGFAAWWDGRLLVFQAASRGAEVLPVSSAVDAYDGQVDWYALREERNMQLDRQRLVTAAVTMLGRSYARRGLFALMLRMLHGRFRGLPDPKTSPDTIFCSQYVSYCYRQAGLDLVEGTDDGSTSPADLGRSPLLVRRGVLRANPTDKEERKSIEIPGRPRGQRKK